MHTPIQDLVLQTRSHSTSFYRDIWGGAEWEHLPCTTAHDFITTPLSKRRYKEEKSIVKIVHSPLGSFLSEWAFSDIALEAYGSRTKRPFVYMTNAHEAIEKSMWCYGNGMVPLIGEKDPDIAAYSASQYEVDQLITDPDALARIRPYLEKRETLLDSMSIIARDFSIASLLPYASYAHTTRLIFALPETGALATASLQESPQFTTLPECIIVATDVQCIVTKLRTLITPVIRYNIATSVGSYLCKTERP